MKDIIPYSQEEAEMLGKALARYGIPSVSPLICAKLLEIEKAVRDMADSKEKPLPAVFSEHIHNYADRLHDVATVCGAQAGEVIEMLAAAVKGPTQIPVKLGKQGGAS